MEDLDIEFVENYQGVKDLRNIVDKDVILMLYPLNVMQIMVLSPKYRMKNNSIKPNSVVNKLILICGLAISLMSYIYKFIEILLDDNMKRYGSIHFLYFASYYDFMYYSSGFIMNVVLHCIHSKNIIKFVLTFQEVHRLLNSETSYKWSIVRNWIGVIIIFSFYLIIFIFMAIVFHQTSWYFILNLIVLSCLDTNLIYAMSLIKLLTDKAVLWNVKVLMLPSRPCSLQGGRHNEKDYNRMFEAYVHILKCYDICKKIFQQPVLYQTVETYCRFLINVQVFIEFRKVFFVITPLVSILLYLWILKILLLQLALSLQFETFYQAVELAQHSCSSILASSCTEDQKKLCKNIQRVHQATFSKMTACGLFYVDICQPLRLMALLTNYTVVLLQFAFL